MSLFKRMMTWGNSEAHSALDHLEDPIKMADQGIRDLRKDLQESLEGFAKVKAQAIRSRRDVARQKEIATDYEQKAMLLLQKMQQGGLAAADGDRLASEALAKRDGAVQRAMTIAQELQNYEKMTSQLENNIETLKHQISKWENELQTLKARAQVSTATRKLNEQLASVDSTGTVAMLERMREKVDEEQSLAEAYGEIAQIDKSVDSEIEKALAGSSSHGGSDALLQLKSRMGLAEPLALPDKSNDPV